MQKYWRYQPEPEVEVYSPLLTTDLHQKIINFTLKLPRVNVVEIFSVLLARDDLSFYAINKTVVRIREYTFLILLYIHRKNQSLVLHII
jgi:hypothetical protein